MRAGLTAKNRDQLRNPTLRNRVWATFTFFTRVSRYQKGKTNLDFAEARDSEWQWHQLGCVQVCTSLQTDNHASTPPLSFLQAKFRDWEKRPGVAIPAFQLLWISQSKVARPISDR